MGFSDHEILLWFSQYAYEPIIVYGAIIGLMILSSFGFPVPEEVTLVSAGMVCYMGTRPDIFPPPEAGADPINVYVTATICFFSVFLSDYLVFSLGRIFGVRLLRMKFMEKHEDHIKKVVSWTRKYGSWAAGMFRFTPGLRFPGHFSCGMLGLSKLKFTAVDGTAALFSVPTQVLLVAYFGETILGNFQKFKIVILGLLVLFAIYYLWRRHKEAAKA